MPQWNLMNLEPYEKELDGLLSKMLDKHPEINVPVMVATMANILVELLAQAPSDFQQTVLRSLIKGEKVKLERKND